jgi:CCR4-NOT transcription complex subunit 7/8
VYGQQFGDSGSQRHGPDTTGRFSAASALAASGPQLHGRYGTPGWLGAAPVIAPSGSQRHGPDTTASLGADALLAASWSRGHGLDNTGRLSTAPALAASGPQLHGRYGTPGSLGAGPVIAPSGSQRHGPDTTAMSTESREFGVLTVDRENAYSVFASIKRSLAQRSSRLYIALDLEFAASSDTDLSCQPFSSSEWYTSLKQFVNSGDIVQIGLVLASDSAPVIAYEINLHLDISTGKYNQKSIDFLIANGHKLDEYRDRGVLAEWAYADLLRHLPFGDNTVTWITFHADRDLAFLMKLGVDGGRGRLPDDINLFMADVKRTFPVMFDVRVLAQLVKPGYTGKLSTLAADYLDVERIGSGHFAGSDALLTYGCFVKILERCPDQGIEAI